MSTTTHLLAYADSLIANDYQFKVLNQKRQDEGRRLISGARWINQKFSIHIALLQGYDKKAIYLISVLRVRGLGPTLCGLLIWLVAAESLLLVLPPFTPYPENVYLAIYLCRKNEFYSSIFKILPLHWIAQHLACQVLLYSSQHT